MFVSLKLFVVRKYKYQTKLADILTGKIKKNRVEDITNQRKNITPKYRFFFYHEIKCFNTFALKQ